VKRTTRDSLFFIGGGSAATSVAAPRRVTQRPLYRLVHKAPARRYVLNRQVIGRLARPYGDSSLAENVTTRVRRLGYFSGRTQHD
jgi:hypothetical protein